MHDTWAWASMLGVLEVGEVRPLGAVCMPPSWLPALSPVGLGKSGGPLVTAGRLHAPRAAVWLLLLWASLHDAWAWASMLGVLGVGEVRPLGAVACHTKSRQHLRKLLCCFLFYISTTNVTY